MLLLLLLMLLLLLLLLLLLCFCFPCIVAPEVATVYYYFVWVLALRESPNHGLHLSVVL